MYINVSFDIEAMPLQMHINFLHNVTHNKVSAKLVQICKE